MSELPLTAFGIAGFRSFGSEEPQIISPLGKINVFVGLNNVGKSNILHAASLTMTKNRGKNLHHLDQREPDLPILTAVPITLNDFETILGQQLKSDGYNASHLYNTLRRELPLQTRDPGGPLLVWREINAGNQSVSAHFLAETCRVPSLQGIFYSICGAIGRAGDFKDNAQTVFSRLHSHYPVHSIKYISALRQARSGDQNIDNEVFSGDGVAKWILDTQVPTIQEQRRGKDEHKRLTAFVRELLDDSDAKIEVPTTQPDEIQITLRGQAMPLSHLGTGIHQVVLIAAAATHFESSIVLLEEPELHIHPTLQRKLIAHLRDRTDNQYFITTHSAHIIDAPGVKAFHVTQTDGSTRVRYVDKKSLRSSVCMDLGYRASDLVQANAVIWVEGPSDRIYIRHWLEVRHDLLEGQDYSIMFYGGALVARLSGLDDDDEMEDSSDEVADLISLLNLNRNSIIVLDSDREALDSPLRPTKVRIENEFSRPGSCWITGGREIENYVPITALEEAIARIHPRSTFKAPRNLAFGCVTKADRAKAPKQKKEINKIAVALALVEMAKNEEFEWEWSWCELEKSLDGVAAFIREANHVAVETR